MGNTIVGLDIGRCFVRVVIGQIDDDNRVNIIGVAQKPSQGLRNGVIVNIDAAVEAIKEAVAAAEMMAGVDVTSVYVAIGGSQVEGRTSSGAVGVDTSKHNRRIEITEEAKRRAIDSARAVVIPFDKEIIHVVPQEYRIDEIPGYKDPLGILGVRLDVSVFIVTASLTARSNMDLCIKRTGLLLNDVMLKTLAASLATLHDEEMELGSILIDLGCDSTDIIVIYKGSPVYITSIPVGGNFVTNDIVQVKGIPYTDAEEIKVKHGCCWIEGSEMEEEVVIREIGARPAEQTTRYELCEIIQPRMAEILAMAKREVVHHSGLTELNGSIVLTGGGALMPGIIHLTQSIWRTASVRIGESSDLGSLDSLEVSEHLYRRADFATAVGLVVYQAGKIKAMGEKDRRKLKKTESKESGENRGGKIKKILGKFF